MPPKMKAKGLKILAAATLFLLSFIPFQTENLLLILAYILVGYEIIYKAFRNILKGKIFDENFLMTIATLGAFAIGEYKEAVAVMLFYQVGEWFQNYAVDKSRKSVMDLMNIRPDYAWVYRNNEFQKVSPDEVKKGETILVKPGEKIPLDGIILDGISSLDTRALTGEVVPRRVQKKDKVLNGCINKEGLLKIKVTGEFSTSTVSKILELVENASSRKSESENFISKFARYYTPIVVLIAVLLAVIPPVFFHASPTIWLYRALSFLVVSCPCALVISIPLSFFGGLGAASKMGILIKGSNYLEALAHTEIIVCDKTGTLTEGVFQVQKIEPVDISAKELLKYATYAEYYSNHPISMSLKEAYAKRIDEKKIKEIQEISGEGIMAKIAEKKVLVGNEKLMNRYKIKFTKSKDVGTTIYIAIDNTFKGTILIADKIKEDSYKAINAFKNSHLKKVVMLTGDRENISKEVAERLQLDEYHAELLPQDKVTEMTKLLTQKTATGKLLFVGDGINDAPVLAMADIGVAMGGIGSDAAIEAADVVIMNDKLSKIDIAIQLSKNTMNIVKENIVFAIAIKILVLILCALGRASMWAAVFADVGVSILAILNALRILKIRKEC